MKIIKPKCLICGKRFKVELAKMNKIKTKCFHCYLHPELWKFDWWVYKLEDNTKPSDLKFMPVFKNKFYKYLGFCEFTRTFFYDVWCLFHKQKATEYWECPNCYKDIRIKKKRKNGKNRN